MEPKKQENVYKGLTETQKRKVKKRLFVKTLRQIWDRYIACLIATRSRDRTRVDCALVDFVRGRVEPG